MLPVPKTATPPPPIKRLSVKNFLNGTVTAYDDGRTPLDGLRSSSNVYLDQDGTVRPRPSLVRYGPQPTGKVLGEIYEFKAVSGLATVNWLICMQSFGASVSPSASLSPSASHSPSASASASASPSRSPSASVSISPSSSLSPSASTSISPSASRSPSASISPSSSASRSISPSASRSPSSSISASPSPSNSPSAFGQIFIARGEDTSWTPVTGKFYDDEALAHYFQIGSKVVIMNGKDTLSYLDIPSSTVIPFVALSNPVAPTLNTNNVVGTTFAVTYRVTANSTVGETAASPALSVPTSTDRDFWNPATQNIIINLPTVTSATSLNIYMGTVAGSEYLIASGIPPTSTTYTDDGSAVQDFTRLFPSNNSTAGPRTSRGAAISGRAFMVGDADNPYNVWNGGDPGFELDFSPGNGGGFSLVGNGTKDLPVVVKSFRDGKGTAQITVLCEGTNGAGKRFILTPDSVTLGTTIISFYDVTEDSGQDGTESPDAVILYGTDLHYPSRDGFKTTGTLPQIQNVLSTKRTSNTIQPDMKTLNLAAMAGACGLAFEGRLYFALPVGSNSNNQIWVLDLDRKGAWMKPWSISAQWMTLYNDNEGNTHFLILSNNMLFDLSYSALSSDNGTPFITSGQSGQVYFSDDKRMWAQLLQVIIVLLRPQGEINFQVTGKTEDNPEQGLGEPTTFIADSATEATGWGEVNRQIKGWGRNRWSRVNLVASVINDATQEVVIEIDEQVQWASYGWNSSKVGVDYNVSDIIYEYIEVGIKDLS